MEDVTRILSEIESGHAERVEQLLPLVYDELRHLAAAKLAREKPGQTLDATALVHEAYLRLLGPNADAKFDGRSHFFAAAAESMRRILVDRARKYQTQKHGGHWIQVELKEGDAIQFGSPEQVLALDEALEHFAKADPEAIELVKLILFGGFSVTEAGQLLDMSRPTAYRNWSFARAWLMSHLSGKKTVE